MPVPRRDSHTLNTPPPPPPPPPHSPDLNTIENAWTLLRRDLAKLEDRPKTEDALFVEAQRLWMALDQEKLNKIGGQYGRKSADGY